MYNLCRTAGTTFRFRDPKLCVVRSIGSEVALP
jgi:hypothetical protein